MYMSFILIIILVAFFALFYSSNREHFYDIQGAYYNTHKHSRTTYPISQNQYTYSYGTDLSNTLHSHIHNPHYSYFANNNSNYGFIDNNVSNHIHSSNVSNRQFHNFGNQYQKYHHTITEPIYSVNKIHYKTYPIYSKPSWYWSST